MSSDLATRLSTASTPIPTSFFATLITANHILAKQRIVDGFGHISARSPRDPSTFFLSANCAPALVSSRSDIVEYRVSDASAVDPDAPRGYLERFIHSEIYKRFPEVMSVVHAHAEETVAFGVSGVPLRALWHMSGVMGAQCPVFEIGPKYSSSARQDLLISNQDLGAALAAGFAPTGIVGKAGSVLKALTGTGSEGPAFPPHAVVLMRGHGFTAVARSVEEAVYRSVYTVANARIQRDAMVLQSAWNTHAVAERVAKVGEKGYEGSVDLGEVKFLSDREAKDAWESNSGQIQRPWRLWEKEVRLDGLYHNEFWEEE